MGREIRRVPKDWQHPEVDGDYVPLFENAGDFEKEDNDWNEGCQKWEDGLCRAYRKDYKWEPIEDEDKNMLYSDYAGGRPSIDDYMPSWKDSEKTHVMMYETCSEGTPISPAFETPEDLDRWLAENGL